ncbi:MAG: capsule assembly Wzi family protein [Ferruginibacter sp.]
MQIIKSLTKLLVFICPFFASAQSTYLTQGDKGTHFVDRLEIKQQRNTDLNFSTLRPLNRKFIVRQTEFLDSARLGYRDSATGIDKYKEWTDLELSRIDEYNMNSLLMNNSEWVSGSKERFLSTKPILKSLYKTKPNMLEVNTKDFFLVVNPMLQISQAVEPGYNQGIFMNSRGFSARGMIGKKIGFATSLTDNQERGPQFFQRNVDSFRAVPGVGFYKGFKTNGVDYFDARGYITFNAAKYVDIQFGYDKNFIGNGYRSLFLSDWGNSYLFLKLNTKIWKFNYQNLFMELMPQFIKSGDSLLDRKYAAMHHLSINVTKWLNIGLFEGIVFGRKNRFDFQYLNPIIFLRHVEGTIGSPDNALAGFDFKANVAHRLQFYGQFLLDEFKLDQIRANTGWWANKWGLQLGMKYIDAFGVQNLDLQFESNRVRPFTYSHNNLISNYTHYNQPLAHPLGANFQEFVGIVRYQPAPKWYINAKAIYYNQGLDSLNGRNYGSNIFRSNSDRNGDFGYDLAGGRKATCLNTFMQVSYEFRENFYFDVSMQYRNYKIANQAGQSNTTLVTAGIRLNMFKREYDF